MPPLDFNFDVIETIEFGIGKGQKENLIFMSIPVTTQVQTLLHEYAKNTWIEMQKYNDEVAEYDPSNKAASATYIYLSLENEMAGVIT